MRFFNQILQLALLLPLAAAEAQQTPPPQPELYFYPPVVLGGALRMPSGQIDHANETSLSAPARGG